MKKQKKMSPKISLPQKIGSVEQQAKQGAEIEAEALATKKQLDQLKRHNEYKRDEKSKEFWAKVWRGVALILITAGVMMLVLYLSHLITPWIVDKSVEKIEFYGGYLLAAGVGIMIDRMIPK